MEHSTSNPRNTTITVAPLRVLVTGAAGFIGMHLCEKLLARGHHVVGIDNFNAYYNVQLKHDRFQRLTGHAEFQGQTCDLCDRDTLEACFQDGGFDVVCNLAAQAGVRYSIEHPRVYQQSNLEGFLNILEACRHYGQPRLVYASSSSVYGGNQKLPFSEDDPVDHPVSLYAATKKANELMAHTYSHLYGLQTVGLRFFTVYGPWGRPDMAIWLFTEAMLAGQPIRVFNHGNMRRDFTYVDDIIQGVVGCIEADNLETYELFNIGNHRSEDLMRLIEVLGQCLKLKPETIMLPMQPGDVPATYADITRIQNRMGYTPTTTIDVGVPRFVDWYRAYHQI